MSVIVSTTEASPELLFSSVLGNRYPTSRTADPWVYIQQPKSQYRELYGWLWSEQLRSVKSTLSKYDSSVSTTDQFQSQYPKKWRRRSESNTDFLQNKKFKSQGTGMGHPNSKYNIVNGPSPRPVLANERTGPHGVGISAPPVVDLIPMFYRRRVGPAAE